MGGRGKLSLRELCLPGTAQMVHNTPWSQHEALGGERFAGAAQKQKRNKWYSG